MRRAYQRRVFTAALRSTDIFIVAHPKSGNTWLAYLLAIVQQREAGGQVTLANVGQFVPLIHGADYEVRGFGEMADPRLFRNEWPLFPDHYPTTIYLLRDPRDVLVSYFHHYQVTQGDSSTSLDEFVRLYLDTGCIPQFEPLLVRWDKQVLEWIARAQCQRVLFVKYEDMVVDRRAVLEKVIAFCGVQASPQDLEIAVTRGALEAMRDVERQHGAESYPGVMAARGAFVRRGRPGGWRDEMSRGAAEEIARQMGAAMQVAGYS